MSVLRLNYKQLCKPASQHVIFKSTVTTKKDVSDPFPPKYTPEVESGWYQWWNDCGYFKPDSVAGYFPKGSCQKSSKARAKFSMVLPPPNVTGVLHIGHALTATIQDSIVRYQRMRGCDTVWVPGTDHAGIATQVLVERQLAARGINRHQLGREKFVSEVEAWKDEKGGAILDQLKQLGASLDWSRTQFTISDNFKKAVDTAFVKLMDAGLLYRAEKLVNWSPCLQSALSDMEVTHIEIEPHQMFDVPGFNKPVELGVMVDIAYKVVDSDQEIVVSTTRAETMLGDTGVAVHPDDERYEHLHGAKLWHPFRKCTIPVVTDTCVDMNLGTGAVKITPGHDHNDWQIGANHGLEVINMMDSEGNIVSDTEFSGMNRFLAREKICDKLESMGLMRGKRGHKMVVPVCHRTGDILEPRLVPQWFLKTEKMAELACKAVNDKDLTLDPEEFKSVWLQFLGEDRHRDWCVSRQIWWGHQLPVYQVSDQAGNTCWVGAHSDQEARIKGASHLGVKETDDLTVVRETDVLDTWFSSALYPFAVFGWPDNSPDLEKFYPLDLMETGHDILFFWVGRMVMLAVALTGKLPFQDVMLHGVVSDSQGRKMSKSLGNVVDPLHLIHGASLEKLKTELENSVAKGNISQEEMVLSLEGMMEQFPNGIPKHGVDPVRWGLLTYDVKQRQINLNLNILNSSGAWCNKIWQLARFLNLSHQKVTDAGLSLENLPKNFQPGLMDMWILSQLADCVRKVNDGFERRELKNVTMDLRKFIYNDVCDTYVEFIKPNLSDTDNPAFLPSLLILHSCVMTSLKMLHPIIPFITEEIYQRLPLLPKEKRKESIMIDSYPVATDWNSFLNENLAQVIYTALNAVTGVRSIKNRYNLGKDVTPDVIICSPMAEIIQCEEIIQRLGNCGNVSFTDQHVDPSSLPYGYSQYEGENVTVFMEVGSHLDLKKEISKIESKLAKLDKDRVKLNKTLKGKFQFRKSPEEVSKKHEEFDEMEKKLLEQKEILQKLESNQ